MSPSRGRRLEANQRPSAASRASHVFPRRHPRLRLDLPVDRLVHAEPPRRLLDRPAGPLPILGEHRGQRSGHGGVWSQFVALLVTHHFLKLLEPDELDPFDRSNLQASCRDPAPDHLWLEVQQLSRCVDRQPRATCDREIVHTGSKVRKWLHCNIGHPSSTLRSGPQSALIPLGHRTFVSGSSPRGAQQPMVSPTPSNVAVRRRAGGASAGSRRAAELPARPTSRPACDPRRAMSAGAPPRTEG